MAYMQLTLCMIHTDCVQRTKLIIAYVLSCEQNTESSDKRNPFLLDLSAPEVGFGSGQRKFTHIYARIRYGHERKADADSLTTMSSAQCSTTADR